MSEFTWTEDDTRRFAAIKDDLAGVSTASACQLLIGQGWRDAYMVGLLPLRQAGLGKRLVGRARTCRYLIRRGPVQPHDILCIDALGVPTSGIIGDILSARMQARGALAAVVHGAVRDSPYIADLNFPVYCSHVHPSHSGRDLMPVDYDQPVNMAGAQVHPGDILLADDEGVLAMPLDLAEYVAQAGPPKERIEAWIRDKVVGGGSIHDYYMPSPEKYAEYESETGERYEH
jgi:regulator of RNase E activity RraA